MGLPFPGEVLYRPADATLFYLHPEEPQWLKVPPTLLPVDLATILPRSGPAWTPFLDQPTRRWDIQAQVSDKAGSMDPANPAPTTTCPPVFTSQHAAQISGLNLAHLQRIVLTIQWLNSGLPVEQLEPCDILWPTPTQAATLGFPLIFSNIVGRWQITGLNAAEVEPHSLPEAASSVVPDAETRLRLLLVQLSPPERVEFLKQNGQLPVARQIDLIAAQLTQESMP